MLFRSILAYLIEHGADATINKQPTPLMCAVLNGHIDAAKFLLNHNADINAQNPLTLAIMIKDRAAVDFLLAHGADVNNSYIQTPLCAAIKNSNVALDLIQQLVRAGADVNKGEPLGAAIEMNRPDIVSLILDCIELDVTDVRHLNIACKKNKIGRASCRERV